MFNNKQAYQTRNTCIITKANQNCSWKSTDNQAILTKPLTKTQTRKLGKGRARGTTPPPPFQTLSFINSKPQFSFSFQQTIH